MDLLVLAVPERPPQCNGMILVGRTSHACLRGVTCALGIMFGSGMAVVGGLHQPAPRPQTTHQHSVSLSATAPSCVCKYHHRPMVFKNKKKAATLGFDCARHWSV
eukprot:scaffold269121_cov17-Tisochrysis_lutea.AAC.2